MKGWGRLPSGTDKGSALILVPTLTLISILLLGIGVDVVAAVFAQRSLDNLSQSCALRAAQALSPKAFYSSGNLVISQGELQLDLKSCLSVSVIPGSISVTSAGASTTGDLVEVDLSAVVRPPLVPSLLKGLSRFNLTSVAYAQEIPTPK